MEEWSKYLLSSEKRGDLNYYIRLCQESLDKLEGEHLLISKYHERLWFQRLMHQSKEELLMRYKNLAQHIEGLIMDIDAAKRELYLHFAAVEELNNSMTPFKNVDLKTIELKQTSLF